MSPLLDHPIISQRSFFPRKVHTPDPFMVNVDDAVLACHLHRPHPGSKTVIYFHGNGEVVSDYIEVFPKTFEVMGLNCLLAEYRGYGGSTGTPGLTCMLGDVAKIVEELGETPQNVVFFGRSIGSIYAIHGASLFPDCAGLILESGVADMLERVLLRAQPHDLGTTDEGLRDEVAKYFDHQAKLGAYRGATLVLHTREDGLVDVSHGLRLHEWAGGPKTLEIFEQGDHNSIMFVNGTAYVKTLSRFLNSL